MTSRPSYIWRVLISFDQFLNTALGPVLNVVFGVAGFGYPDETLSSVFGKYRKDCKLCHLMCVFLDWIDRDHCAKSIEPDEGI